MTRSIVHPIVTDADIAGASAPGVISVNNDPQAADATVINPQRVADESGAYQVELNQDPGAGASGFISLQGKLHPEANYVNLADVDISDFIGSSSPFTQVITDVPILPFMRVNARDDGTWLAAASTTASAWVQE